MTITSTRRRRWLLRLGLLGGSLMMALVCVELGLRLTGFNMPVPIQRDPHRGYAYRPNIEWEHSSEGRARIRTNSFGFRDDEWAIDKPSDTVRIAVLGDSFVEALQVDEEERFTELMQAKLTEAGLFRGRRIEVMNFGISGYGTAQELQTWRHEVRQFQPDFVILSVLTANDIRNNSLALERDPIRPYFIEQDGRLVLDESFRQRRMSFAKAAGLTAARYSRIGQIAWRLYQLKKVDKRTARSSDVRDVRLVEARLMSAGVSSAVYREPDDPEWERAWRVTESLLQLMHQEVTATGARFLVAILSNDIQVDPDAGNRQQFLELAEAEDLFLPDRRLSDYCYRQRIAVLPLAPVMQRHALSTGTHLHGFPNTRIGLGHWNEAGHQLASTIISQWLIREAGHGVAYDRPIELIGFERPAVPSAK